VEVGEAIVLVSGRDYFWSEKFFFNLAVDHKIIIAF